MKTTLSMSILGTGRAVPGQVLTNADLERRLDTSDEWIRTRTGIRERRICGDGEGTLALATEASRQALADAGLTAADLDLIIFATITPEYPFPATACFLQDELGAGHIPAFDLSAACSGFVYALITAAHFVHQGTYRNVLVVSAECMSRFTDYEDRSTCILFGDGAGAAVIGPAERADQGVYYSMMGADGGGADMIVCPAGGSKEPASPKTVNERAHYLRMRGREVYKFAVTKMQEVIEETLVAGGIAADDVAMIIPHQSNLRIIESAQQRLGLSPERVYVNIDRYGNVSGASVAIALDEVRREGRLGAGDWLVLAGFGAGLTWASALIKL
jgi:3-oxoacyl-[acyl-carrier-protein] synthase-3